jgi:hypothetical protein
VKILPQAAVIEGAKLLGLNFIKFEVGEFSLLNR